MFSHSKLMLAEVQPLKANCTKILSWWLTFFSWYISCCAPALLNYSLIVKYHRGNTTDLRKVFATGSQKATQQLTMNWHAWALQGFQKPMLTALQQTSTVLSRQLTRGKQNYGNRLPYFCSRFFSVPHFESRIQLMGFGEHRAAENGFSSHSTRTNNTPFGHYDEYAATESFTKLAAQEVLPTGKQHLLCFCWFLQCLYIRLQERYATLIQTHLV